MTTNQIRSYKREFLTFSSRPRLRSVAFWLLIGLFFKVVFSIVSEYRFYFPANFSSAFLVNRQDHFHGIYYFAFYLHIIASPVALVLGLYLMLSSRRKKLLRRHKLVGRIQVPLVVLFVAPTGVVMASQAYSGPLAGWGFAALGALTAASAIMAVREAKARRIAAHKVWATRCFILLCSPLVLRLTSGTLSVFHAESNWTYRASAWASWLVPLISYEVWRFRKRTKRKYESASLKSDRWS